MLQRAVRIGEVLISVRHQKEFWDGSGEPGQLSGEEIPLPARILHIAVVFEALRTKQPYRGAYEIEEAYGVLKRERGRKFDPVS